MGKSLSFARYPPLAPPTLPILHSLSWMGALLPNIARALLASFFLTVCFVHGDPSRRVVGKEGKEVSVPHTLCLLSWGLPEQSPPPCQLFHLPGPAR